MKKITLLIVFFTITSITVAQQIYLEGGKTMSSLDYKNSQGISLDNMQAITDGYMALGYRNHFLIENLNFSAGLNYVGYGGIGSDDAVGNFMEWRANYLGINTGLDYTMFRLKQAGVYIKAGIGAAFFVQGTQTLNNRVINLNNNSDFDSLLVTFQTGIGVVHPISENFSFYVQYLYGRSTDMAKGEQELKFNSGNVGFGLLIEISNNQSR